MHAIAGGMARGGIGAGHYFVVYHRGGIGRWYITDLVLLIGMV